MKSIKVPPYLQKGQVIGITCPAGFMAIEKIKDCVDTLHSWGFEVVVGKTVGSNSQNYFSGTDDERRSELQAMLDNKSIHAILFGRGGYGMSRIIDELDFSQFRKNPKWLIGYSDITVMHNHLLTNYRIASLHAPMASAFSERQGSQVAIPAWRDAVSGKPAKHSCSPSPYNRRGKAKGILVGGNLSLLAHITGTASDFETKGRILFIEDTGEYLYNVDRMLLQLKRTGKFDRLAGLVVGGFTDMKDTERPFGKSIYKIISEAVEHYDFPVCFDFPVSHTADNLPLKVGVGYALQVSSSATMLKELRS